MDVINGWHLNMDRLNHLNGIFREDGLRDDVLPVEERLELPRRELGDGLRGDGPVEGPRARNERPCGEEEEKRGSLMLTIDTAMKLVLPLRTAHDSAMAHEIRIREFLLQGSYRYKFPSGAASVGLVNVTICSHSSIHSGSEWSALPFLGLPGVSVGSSTNEVNRSQIYVIQP